MKRSNVSTVARIWTLHIGREESSYRSQRDRKLAGICAGLGEYFDCDPTLVRVAWVVGTFLSAGIAILLYLALIFVIPNEDEVSPRRG